MRPSRERSPVGLHRGDARHGGQLRAAPAPTSAGRAGPSSRSTSAVIGASSPAGNDLSMTRKPSTLSVGFLKNVVVL